MKISTLNFKIALTVSCKGDLRSYHHLRLSHPGKIPKFQSKTSEVVSGGKGRTCYVH